MGTTGALQHLWSMQGELMVNIFLDTRLQVTPHSTIWSTQGQYTLYIIPPYTPYEAVVSLFNITATFIISQTTTKKVPTQLGNICLVRKWEKQWQNKILWISGVLPSVSYATYNICWDNWKALDPAYFHTICRGRVSTGYDCQEYPYLDSQHVSSIASIDFYMEQISRRQKEPDITKKCDYITHINTFMYYLNVKIFVYNVCIF